MNVQNKTTTPSFSHTPVGRTRVLGVSISSPYSNDVTLVTYEGVELPKSTEPFIGFKINCS